MMKHRIWLGAAAFMLHDRWGAIHWFALPDTDDNMRMSQVRAWLAEGLRDAEGRKGNRNEIEWNFGKFLVHRDGSTVERFSPKQTAESPEVIAAIEAALGSKS